MRSSLLLAAVSLALAPPVTAQGIAQREIRPGVVVVEHKGGLLLGFKQPEWDAALGK